MTEQQKKEILDYIEDLRKATNRLERHVKGIYLSNDDKDIQNQYVTYYKNNLKVHAAIIEYLEAQKF
jgi:hypothetical protein